LAAEGFRQRFTQEDIFRGFDFDEILSGLFGEGEDGSFRYGGKGGFDFEIFSQGKAVIRIRVGCPRKERISSMSCPSPWRSRFPGGEKRVSYRKNGRIEEVLSRFLRHSHGKKLRCWEGKCRGRNGGLQEISILKFQ